MIEQYVVKFFLLMSFSLLVIANSVGYLSSKDKDDFINFLISLVVLVFIIVICIFL